jgi:Transposase
MVSVEVLAGPERRRRWNVEQKQAIVAAAFAPGAMVRDVARQADVTPSLVYRWRRGLRAAANGFAQVLMAPAGGGIGRRSARLGAIGPISLASPQLTTIYRASLGFERRSA